MSLSQFQSTGGPVPVFKTYIGNLLYSTPDFTTELAATTLALIGQVDIQDIFARDFKELSIADIQNQDTIDSRKEENRNVDGVLRINILSSRQKSPLGSNPNGLFVDTPAGRKVVTVADYCSRIASDGFPVVIALADEVPLFSGSKASSKANARSLLWLKQLKASQIIDWDQIYLFGVVGTSNELFHASVKTDPSPGVDQRIVLNAKDLLDKGCNGLVIGGAGLGETLNDLEIAIRSVKCATNEVCDKKKALVMVQEMDSVKEILLAAKCGVDLIGTNLPQILSTAGAVLTWNLNLICGSSGDANCSSENEKRKLPTASISTDDENIDNTNPAKKHDSSTDKCLSVTSSSISPVSINDSTSLVSPADNVDAKGEKHGIPDEFKHAHSVGAVLNLWDNVHMKILEPILEGCQCHACKNHTKAYIHHLLLANEMLADILIYCHNQHQVVQFFNKMRSLRKEDEDDKNSCFLKFEQWSSALISVMH